MKSIVLSIVLLFVIISSMNIDGISDKTILITDVLGISVPMTPLTADMARFSKDTNSIYQTKFDLIVITHQGNVVVDQRDLDFHINKLPLETSFSNQTDNHYDVELNSYVCRQLSNYLKKDVISFHNSLTHKKEKCVQ